MKSYFVLERQKNPISWEVLGHYNSHEQAQIGLAYWAEDFKGPFRIVKETREIVEVVG